MRSAQSALFCTILPDYFIFYLLNIAQLLYTSSDTQPTFRISSSTLFAQILISSSLTLPSS